MINFSRTATIIINDARCWTRLLCRVTTFRGTVLGTTADGYDVVAAFNSTADAHRFLERYLPDGMEGPIGTYVAAD